MILRINVHGMRFNCSSLLLGCLLAACLLLIGCSGEDSESALIDDTGNRVTRQVPAIVLSSSLGSNLNANTSSDQFELTDQFELDESGRYQRENVTMTLEAVSGSFAGLVDKRLKVPTDTTLNISLNNADTFTEMHIELLTSEPVLSIDALVSDSDKLISMSQPEVTSAGSKTLYFDEFSEDDADLTLSFAQDVEIQEVQIRTNKHLVNQEFTENEVSIYAPRPDDGTGSSITKTVYANNLTDGQHIAVDGRYPREKVTLTVEALTGNLGGYAGADLKINADTTALFNIDNDAQFYALELDIIVPSGETDVEELVTSSDDMLLSLFSKPDGQTQRLSVRSAEAGGIVSQEITFLKDTILKNGDFYGNQLSVGF